MLLITMHLKNQYKQFIIYSMIIFSGCSITCEEALTDLKHRYVELEENRDNHFLTEPLFNTKEYKIAGFSCEQGEFNRFLMAMKQEYARH